MRDTPRVDAAGHYRHLIALGREEFLAAAAPAAFVRHPARAFPGLASADRTLTIDEEVVDETIPPPGLAQRNLELEVYPLRKKPGASFADRITIGRTHNNDVVIADHSVSRLHAYVRQQPTGWVVA
ncbi:MAG TPA: FHA domain-containing protein, partial [Kofleriaceae bacterium]|nr:FHA domain-containing protein [Kofleriaceae bacterium]